MNEDTVNMEIRKFLKRAGVTAQREIEQAINGALESKDLNGNEKLNVSMTLELPALNIYHKVEGSIALE